MKGFTFDLFRSMSAEQVNALAIHNNYSPAFMTTWLSFTARLAKSAISELRSAVQELGCTEQKILTRPRA